MIPVVYRYYAAMHVPSGRYLPAPEGRDGRGGSHVEPSDGCPHLFPTERGAKNYLGSWLRGKVIVRSGYYGDPSNPQDYYEEVEIVPQPHRRREDMLVVCLALVPDVVL